MNSHRYIDTCRVKNLEVCTEIVYSVVYNLKDFSTGFKKQQTKMEQNLSVSRLTN